MTRVLRLALLTALAAPSIHAQDPGARLRLVPAEQTLADGRLHVINVYRAQALALAEVREEPSDSTIERLVRGAYRPYAEFWGSYLGDEETFREWSRETFLRSDSPLDARLDAFLDLDLDAAFESGSAWVEAQTGRPPQGTWYIAFGPGWTDMGGIGGSTMVADLSKVTVDPARLPHLVVHELVHQIHGPSLARTDDPDRGTVLDRIVSEGLATYAAHIHAAGTRSPAAAVGYSEEEWHWSLEHVVELAAATALLLGSRERADLDRVSSRGESVLTPGVGAPGYFLGFRIVEAYVAAHGPGSWTEIVDLHVREALERSGYAHFALRHER